MNMNSPSSSLPECVAQAQSSYDGLLGHIESHGGAEYVNLLVEESGHKDTFIGDMVDVAYKERARLSHYGLGIYLDILGHTYVPGEGFSKRTRNGWNGFRGILKAQAQASEGVSGPDLSLVTKYIFSDTYRMTTEEEVLAAFLVATSLPTPPALNNDGLYATFKEELLARCEPVVLQLIGIWDHPSTCHDLSEMMAHFESNDVVERTIQRGPGRGVDRAYLRMQLFMETNKFYLEGGWHTDPRT